MMENTSSHRQKVVSELHRLIRHDNWKAVRQTLQQQDKADNNIIKQNELPLMLCPNSIGWTAVHFATEQGTPSLQCWKWMLLRVLEDHAKQQQQQQEKEAMMKMMTKQHLQESKEHDVHRIKEVSATLISPFFIRTEAGYSPTDLFFSNKLDPFQWERFEVRQAASRLKEKIQFVLNHSSSETPLPKNKSNMNILNDLKINIKLKQEQWRQQMSYSFDSNSVFETTNNNNNNNADNAILTRNFAQPSELEDEIRIMNEMNETYHGHDRDDDRDDDDDDDQADSYLDALAKFWHQLELLMMASFEGTLFVDLPLQAPQKKRSNNNNSWTLNFPQEKNLDEWNVVHALAHSGCPTEIAKLAVKLYPEQIKKRDRHGNLPIHISASSHNTSALAEGTWYHCNKHNSDCSSSLTTEITRNTTTVSPMMQVLLQTYPEGAMTLNSNGRLPINIAICAGKSWESGICDLFMACPRALLYGSRDIPTRLHPFMLASCSVPTIPTYNNEDTNNFGNSDEVERMRAMRNTSRNIGSMWKFLKLESKEHAIILAKNDVESIRLTTVFELLKIMPDAVRSGITHDE